MDKELTAEPGKQPERLPTQPGDQAAIKEGPACIREGFLEEVPLLSLRER